MKTNSRTDINFASLLADLPPESLRLVEQFALFLREQSRQGQKVTAMADDQPKRPYLYPTRSVPTETLDGLIGMMPSLGGDALEDSEALYDGN